VLGVDLAEVEVMLVDHPPARLDGEPLRRWHSRGSATA
jgi:hypothetical protein